MAYNEHINYLELLKELFGEDYNVLDIVKDGASSSGEIHRIEIRHKASLAMVRIHESTLYVGHPMDTKKSSRANKNKFAYQVLSLYVRSAFLVSTTAVVMNLLEKQDNNGK